MTIALRRFEDGDEDAISRLNRRLEAGGIAHRLYPEDLSKNPTADLDVHPVNHSLYVVADGGEIRGGAWLLEQHFWTAGERHRVGWMKYPVSESLVDPAFAGVPASMILSLLRRQPHLMVIDMGGHDAPFARLLAGIGWVSSTIPMLFWIVRPFRFCRGMAYARRRRWLRWAMDAAAWSGAAWVGHRLWLLGAGRRAASSGAVAAVESSFTPWADAVWEACRGAYRALAVRDARTLDHVYDPEVPNLRRLRVSRDGADIGWVCVQMLPGDEMSAYFGELRVGLVTDLLARPEDAEAVLALGTRNLEEWGADLVITYLTHAAWVRAARSLRFLPGPSTFAFYRSPKAEKLLVEGALEASHLTRSDGDGPRR